MLHPSSVAAMRSNAAGRTLLWAGLLGVALVSCSTAPEHSNGSPVPQTPIESRVVADSAGPGEDRVQLAFGKFQQGRHRAYAFGNGLLHVTSAFADQTYAIGEIERSGGGQSGVFSQAVPGDVVGFDSFRS